MQIPDTSPPIGCTHIVYYYEVESLDGRGGS